MHLKQQPNDRQGRKEENRMKMCQNGAIREDYEVIRRSDGQRMAIMFVTSEGAAITAYLKTRDLDRHDGERNKYIARPLATACEREAFRQKELERREIAKARERAEREAVKAQKLAEREAVKAKKHATTTNATSNTTPNPATPAPTPNPTTTKSEQLELTLE